MLCSCLASSLFTVSFFYFESFEIVTFLSCNYETLINVHFPCWAAPLIDTVGLKIRVELTGCFSHSRLLRDTKRVTEDYLMNHSSHLGHLGEQSHRLIIIHKMNVASALSDSLAVLLMLHNCS